MTSANEDMAAVLFPDAKDRAFIDDHCANCLRPLGPDVKNLFCSPRCRETAEAVRYTRRVVRDGRIEDPLVREAVNKQLAFAFAGGYESFGRVLDAETRAAVKDRDDGLCQSCGKPGNVIDHINGSSSDMSNLQLLCQPCHDEKTRLGVPSAVQEEFAQRMAQFDDVEEAYALFWDTRVAPDEPILLADDEESWAGTWRKLLTARKCRIAESARE